MPNWVSVTAQDYNNTAGYLDLDRAVFAYTFLWGGDPEMWSAAVYTEPISNGVFTGFRLNIQESTQAAAETALQTLLGME